MNSALRAILFTALASLLALLALLIPAHFKAIDPAVLAAAGEESPTPETLARDLLNAAKTAPAWHFATVFSDAGWAGEVKQQARQLEKTRPLNAVAGGPDVFYTLFLESLGEGASRLPGNAVGQLLPRQSREELRGLLQESSRLDVQAILATGGWNSYTQFMPLSTAAGQPLEASLLITALLIQGEHCPPALQREIRNTVAAAEVPENRQALEQLEAAYLAILTLGKRLKWVTLTELLGQQQTLAAVEDAARLYRALPEREHELTALLLMGVQPQPLFEYLSSAGEEGWENLERIMPYGGGAVEVLIRERMPIFQAPAYQQAILARLAEMRPPALVAIALSQPQLALGLKTFLLIIAGYLLALAVEGVFAAKQIKTFGQRRRRLLGVEHCAAAVLLATTLWLILEPELLNFSPREGATLKLDLNAAPSGDYMEEETTMLDQATLIIIGMFLTAQVIMYLLGLMKLGEIQKCKEDAALKLDLLENEDPLFDVGLYIGIGGTVLSLIMLALQIAQLSLIAAYSSTLFGIIFVALLKVGHVRPYRRKLLMQAAGRSEEAQESDVEG